MSRIHGYVVNDNRLLRESLKRLFDSTPDIKLVGAAATMATALEDFPRLSPDILLLQCNLSQGRPPSILQQVKGRFPRLKVLLLGMPEDEEEFITAIRQGATGYLLKDSSAEDIVEAVRALHRNEAVIPKSLSLVLVEFAAGMRVYPMRSAFELRAGLTIREHQLVPLIAARFTNKQIADRLGISEQTVKNHVRSILRKLNVKHRFEIAQHFAQASASSDSPVDLRQVSGQLTPKPSPDFP